MGKFNVGDRVKRVRGHNKGSSIGHVAVISSFEDLGTWANFEDGTSGYTSNFEPAPLFAVGDKVRVVKAGFEKGGSHHEAEIGTVTTITSIDDFGELEFNTDSEWFFYEHEIEPVAVADSNGNEGERKFKEGDKIVLVRGYESMAAAKGATGTVTGYGDECGSIWMRVKWDRNGKDGGQMNGGYEEENFELVDAPLTIREGRYYKTRDGRKVGPMEQGRGPWFEDDRGYSYYPTGERMEGVRHDEIVEEWTDEPAATANGTNSVDAPKFKVGDRVENPYTPNAGHGVIAAVNGDGTYQVIYESGLFGECCDPECTLRLVAEAASGKAETEVPLYDPRTESWSGTTGFTVPLDAPEFAAKAPSSSDLLLARKMVRAGIYTVNEVRETIGLKPIFNGYDIAA